MTETDMNPYKIGDSVRLLRGKKRMYVIDVRNEYVFITYGESFDEAKNTYNRFNRLTRRTWAQVKPFDGEMNEKDKDMNKTKLFKTITDDNNAVQYGTYVGKDGDRTVLSMSDTKGYQSFASDEITEVVPYTIQVNGVRNNGYSCDYEIAKGSVAKGDLLVSASGNLYIVVEVDTACRSPKGVFKGKKVMLADLETNG